MASFKVTIFQKVVLTLADQIDLSPLDTCGMIDYFSILIVYRQKKEKEKKNLIKCVRKHLSKNEII